MNEPEMNERRIILCADDYGISPAVNAAIRDLIARGRINATSVMVVAPSFNRGEAEALLAVAARSAIGLHVTLTAPFRPLSAGFAPLRHGAFLSLSATVLRAHLRSLRPALLAAEISSQVEAFKRAFGRPPDFIDGHQHVHVIPQIRDVFLRAAKDAAPNAWVRQCELPAQKSRFAGLKALLLDRHSVSFHRLAGARGVRTNPAFAGAYAFRADADYAALFPGFLDSMPDGGVIMCHPGKVDAELKRLDPLTDLREREYEFFLGDAFPRLLAERGVAI
jgi:chitin disaccharide deacetylase